MNHRGGQRSTHPLYWGLGGILISYGLMTRKSSGPIAIGAGALLFAVKVHELFIR